MPNVPLVIIMLFLFLAAATTTTTPLRLHFFADAVATSPNPSSYHHLKAKNHILDYIGSKFESTAIATHNTIIQMVKEEYDQGRPVPAESSSPTPTSVPTTSWNTYNPTLSVNEGASLLTTEHPNNEPTVAQGNAKEVEEISSPTLLSSSFPTLQVQTPSPSSSTPTLMRINHKDTDSPTHLLLPASSTPTAEKEDSTSTSPSITSFVTSPSQVPSHITQSPVYDTMTKVVVTSTPSSFATNDPDTTTSPSPTSSDNDDQNTAPNAMTSVSMETPQIICDISLSSSTAESFEQTHTLLVVMTKSIYDILESWLSKELYDLNGISLHVSTQKIIQADSDASSTLRLHASFTGKVSFSDLAPTQSDLIELLLRHFDVVEFTDRLEFPLRLRTLDEQTLDEEPVVKVNSVFFALQDGNLKHAWYKNAAEIASSSQTKTDDRNEAVLTEHQIQMIIVSLVIAALPFVIAASVLLVLRYMDDGEEVAYLEADDEESADASSMNPSEVVEQAISPSARAEMGDPTSTSAVIDIEPSLQVQIDHVPSTPASAKFPLSDISESQSEWSSISDSFLDADSSREIDSPANSKTKTGMGLGIAVAGRQYRQHKSTPYYTYGSQASNVTSGIVSLLWEHDDDLEVYEDYILDV